MCSRPTALQDRTRDSDEDDFHDRDYDVAALANNLSQAFSYKAYGNDNNEVCSFAYNNFLNSTYLLYLLFLFDCFQDHGALDRDDEVTDSDFFLINLNSFSAGVCRANRLFFQLLLYFPIKDIDRSILRSA